MRATEILRPVVAAMTAMDELLGPCVAVDNYYSHWADKIESELKQLKAPPAEHRWLYWILSFGMSNHVTRKKEAGRFVPMLQMGDRCFPHPSMFPPESFPWMEQLIQDSKNRAPKE